MHKTHSNFLVTLLALVTLLMGQADILKAQSTKKSSLNIQAINQYVQDIMTRYGIPGAAVAVIKDNRTIHQNYYGYANLEHQVPVQAKTIFPLLSTTKIPVATAIFRLIEAKKLSLNDKIGQYLPDLPENWKRLEIKYLLAHSSGLPDIVKYDKVNETTAKKRVYQDPMVFNKGELFNYNQTNFWILARIIAQVSRQKFETYLLDTQFGKTHPSVVFSTNMLEIIANRANRYTYLNQRKAFETDKQINGAFLNSCNGLNVSLPAFIAWSKRFTKGHLISQDTKNKMWQKFHYSKKGPAFAYGWEIHPINKHLSYGFSGGYTTAYRTFPENGITIIWLTNGFKKSYSTDPIINYIAGIIDEKLQDSATLVIEKVSKLFFEKNLPKAINGYHQIKQAYPQVNFNKTLHTIASGFLNDNKLEKSIATYNLNIAEYPKSWIGYYGRAQAYQKQGSFAQAIKDYRKAAQLNPNASDKTQLYKMASALKKKKKS